MGRLVMILLLYYGGLSVKYKQVCQQGAWVVRSQAQQTTRGGELPRGISSL